MSASGRGLTLSPIDRSRREGRFRVSLAGARWWSIGLTAAIGAWLGHFFEYVRVAGWPAGVAAMTDSVHSYFFPAGATLMALLVAAAVLARRVWARLGRRLRAAEISWWRQPKALPVGGTGRPARAVGPGALWVVLTGLQTGTWLIQENLEAMSAGHGAPLWGVLTGAHWVAPVVQAEVALILAVAYSVVHRWFVQRRSRVAALERRVARKWRLVAMPAPAVPPLDRVASTPLQRWGSQRWQRPPPAWPLTA